MNAAGSGLCRAAGFVTGGPEEIWGLARVNLVKVTDLIIGPPGRTFVEQAICTATYHNLLSLYYHIHLLAFRVMCCPHISIILCWSHTQNRNYFLSSYQSSKMTISPFISPLCTSDKHPFCYYIATDRPIINNRINGALSHHKPREFFTSHYHYNSEVHIHFRSTNLRLSTWSAKKSQGQEPRKWFKIP
jgi:hypothetical protein